MSNKQMSIKTNANMTISSQRHYIVTSHPFRQIVLLTPLTHTCNSMAGLFIVTAVCFWQILCFRVLWQFCNYNIIL